MPGKSAKRVFALDVPGIHVFLGFISQTWMAGTSPAMTAEAGGVPAGPLGGPPLACYRAKALKPGTNISMPIVNRVADLQPDIQAWRRDIHAHPELLYEVHRTAAFVADRLREFGCDEVVTGLGRTGVVGVIKGRKPAGKGEMKVIGLRADMDALPIEEATDLPYASKTPGKMHACGHDGHTAMLLGAARYLAETRNFAGDAVVIFQPAEEGGAGADAMIKDGLMDRFAIEQVYGMHNGRAFRSARSRSGPARSWRRGDAVDHQDRGARRPRRAAAQMHRFRAGRRAADHRAAVDRLAQRRSAGIGRDFDLRVPRRQRAAT